MWANGTGKRLAAEETPDDERYAECIEIYAGEKFTELTSWCLDLMDEVAAASTPGERERYRNLFLASARYEYRFWDAAWREEAWSV